MELSTSKLITQIEEYEVTVQLKVPTVFKVHRDVLTKSYTVTTDAIEAKPYIDIVGNWIQNNVIQLTKN